MSLHVHIYYLYEFMCIIMSRFVLYIYNCGLSTVVKILANINEIYYIFYCIHTDPEEFLNLLFKHVLHVDPFITIR